MKIYIIFVLLVINCSVITAQMPRNNPVVAKTKSPGLFEKDGAGLAFAATKEDYDKVMKQLSNRPNFIAIKNLPKRLSSEARYGRSIVINGKNISWVLDGNKTRGFVFYGDWNADGDLSNDKPIKVKKVDGKYILLYTKDLTESVENQKYKYQYNLKVEITEFPAPGETERKTGIKYYDSTLRKGILNVNGRQIAFGLIGTGGIYNTQYNNLYFDLNGDNEFDIKSRYSAERYKIPEKYINIGEITYEFSVDRHGNNLTLKPLAEKLPARINLSPGNSAPEFSFTDIDGKQRRLSDFRGKIVLLDFWGLWCAPCVAEAPNLAAAYKKLKEKGFEIVSLEQGDTVEDLRKFISKTEMNWTHLQLNDQLSQLYRIDRYPTYFLLDKEGKIISNTLRPNEELYKKIEQLLEN